MSQDAVPIEELDYYKGQIDSPDGRSGNVLNVSPADPPILAFPGMADGMYRVHVDGLAGAIVTGDAAPAYQGTLLPSLPGIGTDHFMIGAGALADTDTTQYQAGKDTHESGDNPDYATAYIADNNGEYNGTPLLDARRVNFPGIHQTSWTGGLPAGDTYLQSLLVVLNNTKEDADPHQVAREKPGEDETQPDSPLPLIAGTGGIPPSEPPSTALAAPDEEPADPDRTHIVRSAHNRIMRPATPALQAKYAELVKTKALERDQESTGEPMAVPQSRNDIIYAMYWDLGMRVEDITLILEETDKHVSRQMVSGIIRRMAEREGEEISNSPVLRRIARISDAEITTAVQEISARSMEFTTADAMHEAVIALLGLTDPKYKSKSIWNHLKGRIDNLRSFKPASHAARKYHEITGGDVSGYQEWLKKAYTVGIEGAPPMTTVQIADMLDVSQNEIYQDLAVIPGVLRPKSTIDDTGYLRFKNTLTRAITEYTGNAVAGEQELPDRVRNLVIENGWSPFELAKALHLQIGHLGKFLKEYGIPGSKMEAVYYHNHITDNETIPFRDWLKDEFRRKSAAQIAADTGFKQYEVLEALREYGIHKETPVVQKHIHIPHAVPSKGEKMYYALPLSHTGIPYNEWLAEQYPGKSVEELAEMLDTTTETMTIELKRHGLYTHKLRRDPAKLYSAEDQYKKLPDEIRQGKLLFERVTELLAEKKSMRDIGDFLGIDHRKLGRYMLAKKLRSEEGK